MNFKLNAFKVLFMAATVSAVITTVANSVQALNLTIGGTPAIDGSGMTTNVPGASVINFNGGTATDPNGIATYSGSTIVTGTTNQHATPFGDSTPYLTVGPNPQISPITISFNQLMNYFGLYWGSVDSYNIIEFFNGTTSVGKLQPTVFSNIANSNMLTPVTGDQGEAGSKYVNFSSTRPSDYFNKVVLTSSNQFAFESDNHAYRTIPTPALLPGVIALGTAAWRKRNQKAACN